MDVTIPAEAASDRQLLLHLVGKQEAMAEQIDRLNTAVEKELADDAEQVALIEELRSQIQTAQDLVAQATSERDAAVADLQPVKDDLDAALAAAGAAADRLAENDAAEAPEPEPEVPVEGEGSETESEVPVEGEGSEPEPEVPEDRAPVEPKPAPQPW